ncbi:MAG: gamma-glutamyltranspeptidase [bacterium]|nr:MAG: gamma-glutamyltranspeptidase [bacterium]
MTTGVAGGGEFNPVRRGPATRSPVVARHGMVAAAQPLAVQVGVDILKQGGSAVDAAIATNACLALMEPTSCGLGGDLFAIVWDPATGALAGLNASGRAPMALTSDQVPPEPDGTIPLFSPYAWTVPGCVDGWFALHARYGRLPMSTLLAPAIRYAREGFPLSPVIAGDWERGLVRFKDKPGYAEVFMPDGRAPRPGEVFRNPALARTLEIITEDGRDAFYRGSLADAMVRYSEAQGGFFQRIDFERHASTWDGPVSTSYRGYDVWELPPPGQGIAALEMLNILETFDLAAMGRESADFWHVLTEAKKLAFADRARYYADPEFAEVPTAALLSRSYASQRSAHIEMSRAAITDQAGQPLAVDPAQLNRRETTYLCTADASGMMVSLIQSNYTGFGKLGFGLQNRGGCFALTPGHPNRLEPGKRPFHTIIPAFVTKDGRPLMAFGLMGGDMQPQGHAQVIINLLDFGMGLQEAGDAIRFHHTGSTDPDGTVMTDGGILHIEPGLPAAIIDELRRRGHRIEDESVGAYGGYQAIYRDPVTGVYAGATERRKDGCALGF